MTREIYLSNSNRVALVDDEDYDKVIQYHWYARKSYNTCYVITKGIKSEKEDKITFLHRLIMDPKPDERLDHVNCDGFDNCKCNLRIATQQQNNMNKKKQNGIYSSKYKGVSWNKHANKWRSYIVVNDRQHHLGYFTNEIDAAKTYDKKARELYGEFARLNLLEMSK